MCANVQEIFLALQKELNRYDILLQAVREHQEVKFYHSEQLMGFQNS